MLLFELGDLCCLLFGGLLEGEFFLSQSFRSSGCLILSFLKLFDPRLLLCHVSLDGLAEFYHALSLSLPGNLVGRDAGQGLHVLHLKGFEASRFFEVSLVCSVGLCSLELVDKPEVLDLLLF